MALALGRPAPSPLHELHLTHALKPLTFREDGALKTIDIPAHVGASQGELLCTLALIGLSIIRLAEFSLAVDLKAGTLVPLLQDFQDRTNDVIHVLCPRGRLLAPRVKAIL